MTCKDCIHYGVCAIQLSEVDAFRGKELPLSGNGDAEHKCFSFEDRSRFVKLPCSTNETLFIIDDSGEIIIDKVETIVTIGYDEDFSQSQLDCYSGKQYYARDIGKTIFFTKEEAEEELKKETEND